MNLPSHRLEGPPEAPVVVLLNSLGTSGAMWDPQVAALLPYRRVLRVEHPGHGGTPRPDPLPGSVAELGQGLVGLLDHLGIERCSVVGLSLGGMVALWLASEHPGRVDRLVLACTAAQLPPAEAWLERAARSRSEGPAALAPMLVERWFTPEGRASRPELAEWVTGMLAACDPEGYAACCEAIAAFDHRERLGAIEAPTLVLTGAEDPVTPPATALALAEAIPGAALAVLPHAAHLAPVEQPRRTTDALLDHLLGSPAERGEAVRRAVLGDAHVDASTAASDPAQRAFVDLVTRTTWGEVWVRPALDRPTRSAVTLAVLAVLGRLHELPLHVRGALRNGLRPDQVIEVLLHAGAYGGVPAANAAVAVAREVLAEEGRLNG
ncbi:3-oxoadipate enol-lactonase [Aciditerrimonas ferrireducens]|uniref:3-oxoadipate enol-lactonase n=1 Tax=Aciditerrimonas ferrireducens TaxID=667306 RepID=A0ABV6C4G8_9ACTN